MDNVCGDMTWCSIPNGMQQACRQFGLWKVSIYHEQEQFMRIIKQKVCANEQL